MASLKRHILADVYIPNSTFLVLPQPNPLRGFWASGVRVEGVNSGFQGSA